MLYIFKILINKLNILINNEQLNVKNNTKNISIKQDRKSNLKWISTLLPLFLITLFVTGIMTLLQTILPLDLANGGITRPPLTDQKVAAFVTIKLILVAILQWPVGYSIRNKSSYFKFILCLLLLLIGFISLFISNFLINGYLLILLAFIPLSVALCIFLPSASDAIIKYSPMQYRGSAIALYSQCFGISALTIPWISGKIIDNYNTAFQIWLIVSLFCIFLMPVCKRIK
jgi:MFS family permease